MTDYREADFSRLKTVPIANRPNKVDASLLAKPPKPTDRSFAAFIDALPSILAAQDLRYVVDQIVAAAGRRGVLAMLGGHVIKVGLGPLLIALMRRRAITLVAMNGSAAIHDFELAAFGGTSEDVAAGLADGTFGITEASITRRFCKPWTLSSSLTTLDLSVAGPIRQVPIKCQTVPPYWRAQLRASSSVRTSSPGNVSQSTNRDSCGVCRSRRASAMPPTIARWSTSCDR